MKKALVLTSRDNFSWWSMQEIIPAIEMVWENIFAAGGPKADIEHVTILEKDSKISEVLRSKAAKASLIVATASTPSVVSHLVRLRETEKIKAPFFIYIHGDSTAGFMAFGPLRELLQKKDVFVVSCEADAVAVRDSFKNPQIVVVPFPLAEGVAIRELKYPKPTASNPALYYIGRISEQKNLHTLFFAMWILKAFYKIKDITLDIYGREDGYGSPNMDFHFHAYETFLKGLAADLGLASSIRFNGFKERSELAEIVKDNRKIFVSSTLHSDENFGACALSALLNGSPAIVTDWGGHPQFQAKFPGQLFLAPVHSSSRGPHLNPFELADLILKAHGARGKGGKTARLAASKAYSIREGAKRLAPKLRLSRDASRLEMTDLLRGLLLRRKERDWGGQKIFTDYTDPFAASYFRAYGMPEKSELQAAALMFGKVVIPPWVRWYRNDVRIVDPHRGIVRLDGAPGEPTADVLIAPTLETRTVSLRLLNQLAKYGYAFLCPEQPKNTLHHGARLNTILAWNS